MFKKIKCKGVLLKAMNRHTPHMASISFFIFTMPFIIICLCNPSDSTICRISAALLLWYMISLFSMKKSDVFDTDLHKLFTFPVWISLKITVLAFRFFLKRKYPEIEEEHYDRWVKLQKLKRKINGR